VAVDDELARFLVVAVPSWLRPNGQNVLFTARVVAEDGEGIPSPSASDDLREEPGGLGAHEVGCELWTVFRFLVAG